MSFTASQHDTGTHDTGTHHAGRTRTGCVAPVEVTGTVAGLVDRFGPAPTVLAVWSHPDDESFLAGGLLAQVARRGGRVVNVSATSGEHGTDDPVANPPDVLAVRRERELRAALDELGVGSALRFGFGDGSCELVSDAVGSLTVGHVVDQVRPDVIVTFGPDGVTGHPDHRAIARWTRRAVAARGDRIPLVTTVAASAWPSDCIELLHSVDAFWPGYPHRGARHQPTGHQPVHHHPTHAVALDHHQIGRKLAALACHASQMAPIEQALGAEGFRALAAVEAYRAANVAGHRLMGGNRPFENSVLTPIAA